MVDPTAKVDSTSEGGSPSPSQRQSDEALRWYVESLFGYTNQLMERMQLRCNYLILASSVAMVSFFAILNALLSNRIQGDSFLLDTHDVLITALLPSVLFIASLVVSVTAFLPRIYDHQIEINQQFVASMPVERYRDFVVQKAEAGAVERDFIDEIHVLSRILNDRSKRVDRAAHLFIAAIFSMALVVGAAAA